MHRIGSPARLFTALALALVTLAIPARLFAQAPTFNTLVTTTTVGQSFQHPQWSAAGDFNGDSKLDTLTTNGSSTLSVMLGLGTGAFSPRGVGMPDLAVGNVVNIHPSLVQYLPHFIDGLLAIRAADVNGDGRLDAVAMVGTHINFGSYYFMGVLINTGNDANGTPQFAVTYYYTWVGGQNSLRSLTVGNLNGDARPDFIMGDAYGNLQSFLNDGLGNFTAHPSLFNVVPQTGGPSTGPGVIADLNGDGKGDFIESSGQAGATNVFLGNGDGTFQAPVVIQLAGRSPGAIAAADLNNDGKPDFVEALSDGSVAVFLNDGNGTFGAPDPYQLPPTVNPADLAHVNGATSVAIGDLNGDGNLDLVAGYAQQWYASYGVAMFLGNGDGTFGPVTTISMTNPPFDVSVNDFNGDGKPDIAMVGSNNNTYGVLLNTTVFTPPLPTQTLTILGGSGNPGDVAANVEYYNPTTGQWQPAYLAQFYNGGGFSQPISGHPWGNVPGTNQWINYRTDGHSDPGASGANRLQYLYRVRFTVPADAVNPTMTFSLKADNFAQVAINGVAAGGLIVGAADQVNVDAVFSQSVLVGENTITLNIGDEGGLNGFNFRIDLSMQSSQSLEIVPVIPDTTAPVITAPADIIKEATSANGAVATFTATATDDKDGTVSVAANPASGSTFPIGPTTVNLSASDQAGNTATASFTVTVQDTIAPVVSVPGNIVAEATSASGAAVSYPAPTATDVVGVTSLTSTPPSGSTFALGSTTVSAVALDAAGNRGSATFTITVVDTTAPVITSVPANQTIEATSAAGAVATFDAAVATDAVGVTSLTYSQASGSMFGLGPNTVIVTAMDAAGHTTTGSFTITVVDTTAPAIASVTPSQATLWPPNHKMVAITVNAVATDAVGVTSLKIISVTSSEADNGHGDGDTAGDTVITGLLSVNLRAERSGKGNGRTYTITVEARDAAGNTSTKTCTVFVPKSQGGDDGDHDDRNDDDHNKKDKKGHDDDRGGKDKKDKKR